MTSHVAVVGSGPVGAVASLILARNGVSVTLIERNESLTTVSSASTFHPSTLDLLDTLGITLAAHPAAVVVTSLQWRNSAGSMLTEVGYDLLAGLTDHPFRIHLDQQILLDRLAELISAESGIELRLGTAALDLDSQRGRITTITKDNRREIITADAIVGCDGSHSMVRQRAGIGLTVHPYPTTALRVHVDADLNVLLPPDAPRPLAGLCYFRGGNDGLSALRMDTTTRLIVRTTNAVPPKSRIAEALTNATPFRTEDLSVQRFDSYRLSRGVVDSYLSPLGPIMVIGDSAHVTSTAGGMNMNSGIHDAFAMMPALADWLGRRTDKVAITRIAEERRHYLLNQVIPRTERRVDGLQDRHRDSRTACPSGVESLGEDHSRARKFLVEASLLDSPPYQLSAVKNRIEQEKSA